MIIKEKYRRTAEKDRKEEQIKIVENSGVR
jgi:hypothetical protein